MIDERDIRREKAEYYEICARRVIDNLARRKMNGYYAPDSQAALAIVMDMIPGGVVVARGDGITLDQIGLIEAIQKRGQNTLIDPFQTDADGRWPKDREQMMRETFFADVLVAGTNAITQDGRIVNIDGYGNRLAAIIFGPAKVILVVGANKIVKNVDEGLQRIHQYAAPVNARRHLLKHHSPGLADLPCVKTGSCADCRQDWRICNYTVIIDGAMPQHQGRINVVIVGEELGI